MKDERSWDYTEVSVYFQFQDLRFDEKEQVAVFPVPAFVVNKVVDYNNPFDGWNLLDLVLQKQVLAVPSTPVGHQVGSQSGTNRSP